MSLNNQRPIATAAAPGLLTQVGMAGGAAVITVSFIHPIDVVKVCPQFFSVFTNLLLQEINVIYFLGLFFVFRLVFKFTKVNIRKLKKSL